MEWHGLQGIDDERYIPYDCTLIRIPEIHAASKLCTAKELNKLDSVGSSDN